MGKRYMSILLAVALLSSLCAFASAAGAEFAISQPEMPVKKDQKFSVDVELSGNPGFSVLGFTLEYDKNDVTCTAIAAGELMENLLYVTNPNGSDGAIVGGVTVEPQREDGRIARFYFVAQRDLESIDFAISNVDFTDSGGNQLTYSVKKVTQNEEDAKPDPVISNDTGYNNQIIEEDEKKPVFPDVENHWGREYVEKAAEMKLFNGYPNGNFGPDDLVTRGQFVTVLYRYNGSPAVTDEAPFTDIKDEPEEFRNAIAWAYSKGIVNGISATEFAPKAYVERQQAVKILFALSGSNPGAELMFYNIYDETFSDSASIADWAKTPMYWAIYNGIISGATKTTLAPSDHATRAQLAKILIEYINKFGGASE